MPRLVCAILLPIIRRLSNPALFTSQPNTSLQGYEIGRYREALYVLSEELGVHHVVKAGSEFAHFDISSEDDPLCMAVVCDII